jgi:uncharacterized protein
VVPVHPARYSCAVLARNHRPARCARELSGSDAGLFSELSRAIFVVFFMGGPLAEEPGWRGFALPRLQRRYGPLQGTLLLGVLWACWHLPHFLTPAQHGGPGTGFATFAANFPIFVLLATALAIIFTWVFNHTEGSLLIAILMHTSVNANLLPVLFPAPLVTKIDLFAVIGFAVPALLIVILTRGGLGYQLDQKQIESNT